jgi:hypothetical protein
MAEAGGTLARVMACKNSDDSLARPRVVVVLPVFCLFSANESRAALVVFWLFSANKSGVSHPPFPRQRGWQFRSWQPTPEGRFRAYLTAYLTGAYQHLGLVLYAFGWIARARVMD